MKYTETKDTVTIVIDKHSDDDYEGFLGLIKLGLNCNANTYNLCVELNTMMNKPADPKEQMINAWEEYEQEFKRDYAYSDEHKELRDEFFAQIGEAMGPVCYVGWQLKNALKEHDIPTDWIDKCIEYYEKNWRF